MDGLLFETNRLQYRMMCEEDKDLILALSKEMPRLLNVDKDETSCDEQRESVWKDVTLPNIVNVIVFLKDSEGRIYNTSATQ